MPLLPFSVLALLIGSAVAAALLTNGRETGQLRQSMELQRATAASGGSNVKRDGPAYTTRAHRRMNVGGRGASRDGDE